MRGKGVATWIMTGLSVVGTGATAVLTAIETPKALAAIKKDERENGIPGRYTKWDAIKAGWKSYIPAIGTGLATILCTTSIGIMSAKAQRSLAGSYALLDQAYRQYRGKVKEYYLGKEVDQEIQKEQIEKIAREENFEKPSANDLLFFEEYSNKYFNRTMTEVVDAEYRLNRDLAKNWKVSLNDFYDYLNLPKTDLGNALGWSYAAGDAFYGYDWIEFEHILVKMDDGLECYILHMPFGPTADYLDEF